MNIHELINWGDTQKRCPGNVEEFFDQFNLGMFLYDVTDELQTFVEEVPIYEWLCTDTHVGLSLVYFRGRPVALSHKLYRKSNTEYYWIISRGELRAIRQDLFDLIDNTINDMVILSDEEKEMDTICKEKIVPSDVTVLRKDPF